MVRVPIVWINPGESGTACFWTYLPFPAASTFGNLNGFQNSVSECLNDNNVNGALPGGPKLESVEISKCNLLAGNGEIFVHIMEWTHDPYMILKLY